MNHAHGPTMPCQHVSAADAITKAVGLALRRVRATLGWTRRELLDRIPPGSALATSVQSLQNYEYGIRHMTVPKFVQLCQVLDVAPDQLLALALERAEIQPYTSIVRIDLGRLALTGPSRLRDWAHRRQRRDPDRTIVHLDQAEVDEIAILLGIGRQELVTSLEPYMPDETLRWQTPSNLTG